MKIFTYDIHRYLGNVRGKVDADIVSFEAWDDR